VPKSAKNKKVKVNFKPYFIHYFYCLAAITLLILTFVNINKFFESKKVLGTSVDTTPLQNEKVYWQSLVNKNPTYIDGYLELAKIDVELGDKNEATNFIIKALTLSPNSTKITEVQKQLGL